MRGLIIVLFLSTWMFAGTGKSWYDPAPGKCVFGVSGGLSFSANDFSKQNDDVKPGFTARLHFPSCQFITFQLEYNHLFPFDINSAWVDVKARDYDGNVYFGSHFQGGPTSFHAFTGLCVKTWDAEYTGVGENRITSFPVPAGTRTQLFRFCANFGIALERKINDLSLFGDFRFRLSPVQENVKVEIMDIMYAIGFKYNLVYKQEDKYKKERFKLPGRKYDLD